MRISAWIAVYNEEERIRYTLESAKWCDEIIVVDKTSTDKTVEICKEYGAHINIIKNSVAYDPKEFDFLSQCTGDWIILLTASDIIDKTLAIEIKRLVNILPDNIKCINVPFRNYILGIHDSKSPWYSPHRSKVFRRDNYKIENDVHGAFHVLDHTSYTIPEKFGYFSHLTHVSVDMMLDRHTRYWRSEGLMYEKDSLQPAFHDFVGAVNHTLINKKSYKLGWDGIAISMAYISYYMFSFLYKWERLNNNKAADIYKKIREDNYNAWNNLHIDANLDNKKCVEHTSYQSILGKDNDVIDFMYFCKKRTSFSIILRTTLKLVRILDNLLTRIYR